jgi:uncharacterized membrane protein YfcA
VNPPLWVFPAFALIAATYASVGLGGATAYAAVLSLTGTNYAQIPPLVLALNLLVAGSAHVSFHRAGRVPYQLLLPLVTTSVPAAFLGGLVPLRERQFLLLLAAALLVAGIRFLLGPVLARRARENGPAVRVPRLGALLAAGLGIGFLAGMTGIGGGVYLGPILLLTGTCTLDTVRAVTAGFVFFNSAAALGGQLTRVAPSFDLWLPLAACVVAGAFAGALLSLRWLPVSRLQRVFGCVLIAVALLNAAKVL